MWFLLFRDILCFAGTNNIFLLFVFTCSLNTAFVAVSCLMTISAALQLSLVSPREWAALFGRVDRWKKKAVRRLSRTQSMFCVDETAKHRPYPRTLSMPEDLLRSTVTWKMDEQGLEEKKDA